VRACVRAFVRARARARARVCVCVCVCVCVINHSGLLESLHKIHAIEWHYNI